MGYDNTLTARSFSLMRVLLRLIFVGFILLAARQVFAQQNNAVPLAPIPIKPYKAKSRDTTFTDTNGIKQIDIGDVIAKMRNRQTVTKIDSITSKPIISVIPGLGYTLVSRFAVVLSGNVVFRTGPQSKISTIIASTSYTQNKQFTLPVQTSIWTKNNNFDFVGDYRFYKYPQSTFGLGSASNFANEDPMDYSYFEFYETVLRKIARNFYLGLGFVFDDHWDISDQGNLNGTIPDYADYGKTSHSIASGFTFNALFDSRDNAINSSRGVYATLQYRDNYTFLGSNTGWRSLIIDVRRYFRFPNDSQNVIALWSYDWLVLSGRPAYLDLPSTQWDANSATGRGYIQGRFRGAQMVYLEGEYRFRLTANGLLGGVVFLNGESLSAAPGTSLQSIQPGFGPGVRIKLNKVSNTNVTIDYGFGREGSRGLFIDVGEAF